MGSEVKTLGTRQSGRGSRRGFSRAAVVSGLAAGLLMIGLAVELAGFDETHVGGAVPGQGEGARGRTDGVAMDDGPAHTYVLEAVWRAEQTGVEVPVRISASAEGELYVLDQGEEDGAMERVVVLDGGGEVVGSWTFEDEFLVIEPDGDLADYSKDGYDYGIVDAAGVAGDLVVLRSEEMILSAVDYPGDSQLVRHMGLSSEWEWGNAVLRRYWYGDELYPYRVWPAAMGVNRDRGELYVLDVGGPTVVTFDLGTGERKGRPNYLPPALVGAAQYEFDWYVDIDVMADGRVLVLNQAQGELVLMQPGGGGAAVERVAVPGRAMKVAAVGSEAVLVLDETGWVRLMSLDGEVLALFDGRGPEPTVRTRISDVAMLPTAGGAHGGTTAGGGAAVVVADQESGDLYVYRGLERRAPEVRMTQPHCRIETGKSIRPGRVKVGGELSVKLEVAGWCPERVGTDILLVLERGMAPGPSGVLKFGREFARRLIETADLGRDRIGLMTWGVRVGQQVQLDVPLTSDREELLGAVDSLEEVNNTFDGWYGSTDPRVRCLSMARAELGSWRARPDARQVVVIMADGRHEAASCPAQRRRMEGDGARLVSVMSWTRENWEQQYDWTRDEPRFFMRSMASSWWDYYETGRVEASDAEEVYSSMTDEGAPYAATVLARTAIIRDVVPSNMEYVSGSASPTARWDAQARTLSWQLTDVPLGGVVVSYRLRPRQVGQWPTNTEAWVEYVDGLGQPGRAWFDVPRVDVVR